MNEGQGDHDGAHGRGAVEGRGGAQVIALRPTTAVVAFTRAELGLILAVYGRMVAAGEWKDYALDFERHRAVFSIFRRAAETPLFRVEKAPHLARKQGAYSVVAIGGRVMKRGHDLARVLDVFDKKARLAPV
jgi:hypothetical protein